MRKIITTAVAATTLGVSSLFFWDAAAVTPPDNTAQAPTPAVDKTATASIARGLYLARAGDCIACHTASGGKPFAGGLALQTPFGKILASNITPDRDTGIGTWSEQEFVRAVRNGVGKHGQYLYPAMPYTAYVKVSDADLHDIKAYLDTVAPVHNAVDSNQLPFPFNIRLMMFGWNLLFFDKTPFSPQSSQTVEWNRGAYLVEGLGHCAACHTGKNFLGGDKATLQGGSLQGWYAPEITSNSYSGLGGWSVPEVVAYLKTGGNAHTVASGPMAEAVTNSTQYLSDPDLRAMAVYLKSYPGSSNKPVSVAADAGSLNTGKGLFMAHCAACHDASGRGVTGMIPSLAGSAGVRAPEATNLLRTVLAGGRGAVTESNPTGAEMPGFSWKLSDADVATLASYVRSSWGNAAAPVDADAVAKVRKQLGAPAALRQ